MNDLKKVSKQRYMGCLQGGAIGDALGAPIEFYSLDEIRTRFGKKGIKDYIEYQGNKGEFTDDTQMTLFTAEALLRGEYRSVFNGIKGTLNALAHQSYLRWLHTQDIPASYQNENEGNYDIERGWLMKQKELNKKRAPGKTVLAALQGGRAGRINNPINNSKGCGTVMRIAPVGLMYYGNRKKAFTIACDFAAITHGHPTGYLCAGFLASVISDLAINTDLRKSIENAIGILKKWDNYNETLNAIENCLKLFEDIKSDKVELIAETIEKLGNGWIAEEALSMSLFACLVYKNNFKNGVLFAVNHGGDSDSTGAITGNILGLINGLEQIPDKWIERLLAQDIVKQMGEDLHTRLKGNKTNPDYEWKKKYAN